MSLHVYDVIARVLPETYRKNNNPMLQTNIHHQMRTLLVSLVFALLTLASRADTAADVAALKQLQIQHPCPLIVETPLVRGGVPLAAIVPASGEPWIGAAAKLQSAISSKTGVTVPIIPAEKITDADWSSRHLVILGNLLVSPVYARLYNNYFVCADAAYTGAGGYELRTVHNPWGTGRNAVALGAQDAAGVEAAIARLVSLINEHAKTGQLALPRLLDLHFTPGGRRVPLETVLTPEAITSQKKAIDDYASKAGQDGSVARSAARFAMLYHRTGDEGWFQLFRHALRRHLEFYATDEYVNQEGPRRYDRDFRDSWAYRLVIAWDLLEEHPGWTDAERLEITNHMLRLVFECNLKNGWDSPRAIKQWMKFDSIPHNHQTWPGLANLFGGLYFSRHYQIPIAQTWLSIAKTMFHSASRSSKPQEDSSGYEWIPQRHILMYALATGDRTYIEQGHAAATGRALLMSLDPLGHQPAWGDHEYLFATSQMPELLSLLEYALGDGRFRWMIERLGVDARGEVEEPHWTPVEPKCPDELTGVSVSYLPRIHFDMLGSDHDDASPFRAPNLPFEQTFDKLVLRSGLGRNDDYLMLDGYAGGGHGHLDGNAIISFTSRGAHWLVDGEYIRRTPKYHCAVTVQRDGISRTMPTNARLDAAVWFGDGALTRTVMPHYNGMTWSRSLIHVSNGYVAVVDELTAEEPGDYSLRCCWRMLGYAELKGDTVEVHQREKGFALRNLSGQRQELVFIKNSGESIYSRTAGVPIHQLYQLSNQHLDAGQTVRFINVFAAASDRIPTLDAASIGDRRARIIVDGRMELFGVDGLGGPANSDAAVYRLTADSAWLANAKHFSVGPHELLALPQPGSARLDARGLALGTPQSVPAPGLHPAETMTNPRPSARPIALSAAITEMSQVQPSAALSHPPAGLVPKSSLFRWRFADFQNCPSVLEVSDVQSDVPPRDSKRPINLLIDGKFTGSTDSCIFPSGKTVSITVDLGYKRHLSEVRVHAWEAYDWWKTKDIHLTLSNDRFQQDIRDAGGLLAAGRTSFGTNIDTLHSSGPLNQTARYLRVTAEPLTAKAGVYFSEIEVLGFAVGEKPKLTAVASTDLNGNGHADVIVGDAAGEIVAIDSNGKELWRKRAVAGITALAAGSLSAGTPPVVICGADDATLQVYASDGRQLASVTPPDFRYVQSRVRNITLADLDGDGTAEIVIGCDSWQYMAYKLVSSGADAPAATGSYTLKLAWKGVYYAHAATVCHIADLDGDGHPEIVAGNDYYSLQIMNNRGKVVASGSSFGPEQTAVTSVALPAAGRRAVVVGIDDGDVVAFDFKGKRLWMSNVGDRVTTLRSDVIDKQPRVIAASEGGIVSAFDSAGHRLWSRNLGSPAKRLVREGDTYLAAAAQGVICLSLDGQIRDTVFTPAPAFDLVTSNGTVFALLTDGSVICLRNE